MKQKKRSFLILSIFFLIIFIIGVSALIIPHEFENFSYSDATGTIITKNHDDDFDVSFKINNKSNQDFTNFKLYIKYSSQDFHFKKETREVTIDVDSLESGETKVIDFSFRRGPLDISSMYTFGGIELVEIQTDSRNITVYADSMLIGPNWYFFGMTVIGFFGSFVMFIFWKTSDKQYKNPVEENIKSFTQRIQESFQPIIENSKPKDERIVCHYCKCKYDGLKHNKCPNCGAPPEHKD